MRKHKFRAWDTIKKKMYDKNCLDLLLHFDGKLQGVDKNGVIIGTYNTPDLELMQYIGLKDISKQEVYEGDLLQDEENYLWEVIYKEGKYVLENIDFPGERDITDCKYLCKVGNVYENSKLLK